jgi:hypothetical protein
MNLKIPRIFVSKATKFITAGLIYFIIFQNLGKSQAAEVVTLSAEVPSEGGIGYSSEAIELGAGDVAEILSAYSPSDGSWSGVSATIRGKEVDLPFLVWGPPSSYGSPSPAPISKWVIAGPATLRARAGGYSPGQISFFTASITRAGSTPSQVPMGAVVIPENPSGNYSVIMESSSDMITWTAANPGTYGGTEQKRFFRLRAEQTAP